MAVEIRGAFGPNADTINGLYVPDGRHRKHTSLRKIDDDDLWLYRTSGGDWVVSPTEDKDAEASSRRAGSWCQSQERDSQHPTLTTRWHVSVATNKFETQGTVCVRPMVINNQYFSVPPNF